MGFRDWGYCALHSFVTESCDSWTVPNKSPGCRVTNLSLPDSTGEHASRAASRHLHPNRLCQRRFTSPLPPATFKHDEVLSHMHFWLHKQSLVHRLPFYPLPASWESAVSRSKLCFPAAEEGSGGTAGTCRMAACHSVTELGNKWGRSLHRVNEKGYLGEITESVGNNKHTFQSLTVRTVLTWPPWRPQGFLCLCGAINKLTSWSNK